MNQLIGGTLLFGGPAYVLFRALPYLMASGHRNLALGAMASVIALISVAVLNAYAAIGHIKMEGGTR